VVENVADGSTVLAILRKKYNAISMKTLLTFSTFLLMSIVTFAQQKPSVRYLDLTLL